MGQEKRDAERIPILGELHGEMMVFQPMVVREISRSGATVETPYPLHLNSLHELRLTLGERLIVIRARVVHSRISDVDQELVTYRSGMEFIDASEHVMAAIGSFLDAVKDQRTFRYSR